MTEEEIDHVIAEVDKNGDGKIQMDEFMYMLLWRR